MITIGIIEDLIEVSSSLSELIKSTPDFELIGCFSNGEDALDFFIQNPCNVIIVDINLPGISGLEFISEFKQIHPGSQLLVFTIYEDSDRIFEAIRLGANGYLLKKTNSEKIIEAIKEVHSGGAPMSPQIAFKVINFFRNSKTKSNTFGLTTRECEIIEILAKGLLYKEIAEKLFISVSTVKQHIHSIYDKLHVQNKTEAINKFYNRK